MRTGQTGYSTVAHTFSENRRRILAGLAGSCMLWAGPTGKGSASARGTLGSPALERALERVRAHDQLHGLVIARDGEILSAEALRGPPLDRAVNVKSVSKTLVATLTGIAIDRGVLDDVNQPVLPLLPRHAPADPDPLLDQLTIDHLLTMRAGLERTSGSNYGRWVSSGDWVRFALDRPFVDQPGGRMLYSTGSYHLLSAILTEAAGRSLLALARKWLGAPLGIEIPPWTRDPQGYYFGGNNMLLSPLALLRFAEMYRLQGEWDGTRVVSAGWVERSWRPRTRSPFSGDDYDYGWFIDTVRGHPVRYARGYGGQIVYIVPDLGLSVVITSDPNRPARSGGYFGVLRRFLTDDLIPAAESA
jgi:CubicO group peptidase (beta-lactamase class C family)